MPFVRIDLIKGRTEDQKAAIAAAITDALVQHAGATPQSVWVAFDEHEKDRFAIGGTLVSRRPPAPKT